MRILSVLLFLLGLALLGNRETIGFGIMLIIGGGVLFGRTPDRGGEDRMTAMLLVVGGVGALAVVAGYVIERL